MRIDGIARRARNIADDDAILAQECVDKRGLSYIRAADDGNADLIRLFFFRASLGKECDERIEQIAEIHCVRCGNRHRIAQAEVIELVDIGILLG